ncbi:MAG: DUF1849 family protein [Rhodospirillales bacterium]|jgi:hypothetical protein|nr:DUF1849 family protein [Rhodospirillales bacterium]
MAKRHWAVVSLLCAWVAIPAAPASSGGLVAHRALYRITLAAAAAISGVVDAQGSMFYRFADACDGWTAENRTLIRFHYLEEDDSNTGFTFSSWESKDGLRFRFRARHERDGEVVERLKGEAGVGGIGGEGTAHFDQPQELDLPLPAGTSFPTAHMQELIEAARRGEIALNRLMFDSSGPDYPFEVNAVISGPVTKTRSPVTSPDDSPRWMAHLAFFPLLGRGAEPDFEVDILFRADGIADFVRQDLGDITLEFTLDEVELLSEAAC